MNELKIEILFILSFLHSFIFFTTFVIRKTHSFTFIFINNIKYTIMFGGLLDSVKSLLQSDDKKEAVKKVTEALNKALEDNTITPEELAEVQKLQKDLNLTDADLADIKIKILDNMLEKISADGKIDDAEVKLFNEIKASLGVEMKLELKRDEFTKEELMKHLGEAKDFLVKVKDKSVVLGGSVIDKAKNLLHTEKVEEKK